jgi:hypothetical protein
MLELGLLTYDVPLTERSVYNKLRQRIRRVAIALNWSAYLIPWGLRETVKQILAEIQSEKPNVVSSNVIKFDSSEEKVLMQAAERGLNQIIRNAHKQMMKRLTEAEAEHKEAVTSIDATFKTKNRKTSDNELTRLREAVEDQLEINVKKALAAADKSMKEATSLSVVFCLTNQVEAAIAEMTTLIDHRRELVKAKDAAAKISTAAPAKVGVK